MLTTLISCNSTQPDNNKNVQPPLLTNEIASPYISSYVDYISWYRVNNATEYKIYRDGTCIGSVTEDKFQISDFSQDYSYYVIAYNGNIKKESQPSNIVTIAKHENFEDGEVLDLSGENSFSGIIDDSIRKIIISNNKKMTFLLDCKIGERQLDLIIDLHNVDIKSTENCISTIDNTYSLSKHNYNLVLNISGDCSISGSSGFEYTYLFEDDTEQDGINGGDGGIAIIASSIVVRGRGTLTISGGNGGNGSKGSSTTDYSTKVIGKGSSGGNGGDGVHCQNFIVNMSSDSAVSIIGGTGGRKGDPGNNCSIVTGPIISMMYNSVYDIGKNGNDGIPIKGKTIIIQGRLKY